MSQVKICALYKFAPLKDIKSIQAAIRKDFIRLGIKGTLLIAHEGINGTIAGQENALEEAIACISNHTKINNIPRKYSYADKMPFYRTKVRLKKEIVTLGVDGIDPNKKVGTYVKPKDWNELISREDVILVDTRNDYEYSIGTFKGAIDPKTKIFREFPQYVAENLDPSKHKKVAMFCTGGIRCEKASAFMLEKGFEEVYHLEGGILQYLEDVPAEESLWEGTCFVFDHRVAVRHGVEISDVTMCHACRAPLTEKDRQSEFYTLGVSCPKCHDKQSETNRARASERQKQMEIAQARGIKHLG